MTPSATQKREKKKQSTTYCNLPAKSSCAARNQLNCCQFMRNWNKIAVFELNLFSCKQAHSCITACIFPRRLSRDFLQTFYNKSSIIIGRSEHLCRGRYTAQFRSEPPVPQASNTCWKSCWHVARALLRVLQKWHCLNRLPALQKFALEVHASAPWARRSLCSAVLLYVHKILIPQIMRACIQATVLTRMLTRFSSDHSILSCYDHLPMNCTLSQNKSQIAVVHHCRCSKYGNAMIVA